METVFIFIGSRYFLPAYWEQDVATLGRRSVLSSGYRERRKSLEIEQVEGHAVPLAAVLCVFKQKLWTLFDRFLILKPNWELWDFFHIFEGKWFIKNKNTCRTHACSQELLRYWLVSAAFTFRKKVFAVIDLNLCGTRALHVIRWCSFPVYASQIW